MHSQHRCIFFTHHTSLPSRLPAIPPSPPSINVANLHRVKRVTLHHTVVDQPFAEPFDCQLYNGDNIVAIHCHRKLESSVHLKFWGKKYEETSPTELAGNLPRMQRHFSPEHRWRQHQLQPQLALRAACLEANRAAAASL